MVYWPSSSKNTPRTEPPSPKMFFSENSFETVAYEVNLYFYSDKGDIFS